MSVIATALKHMLAAGMNPEAVVAAIAEMEAEIVPQRSKGALRQAKYEEKKRQIASESVSTDVPDDNDASPLPPDKSPPDPQKLTPTPRTHTRDAGAREDFPRPEWADPQVWKDFLANRRRKSLVNSPTAHRKFLADVERLSDDEWPPGRLLEAAVGRGWGAIYEGCKDDDGRQANRGSGGTSAQRLGGPRPDPLLAMHRAARAAAGRGAGDRDGAGTSLPAGQFG